MRLEQCIDPNDPELHRARRAAPSTGTGTISFPDNFPDEFFWYVADVRHR